MIRNRKTSSTTIATETIMPTEKAATQAEANTTTVTITKVTPTIERSSSSLSVGLQSTLNDSANLESSSVHKVFVTTGGILSNSTRTCLLTNPSPKILTNVNKRASDNSNSGYITSDCSYGKTRIKNIIVTDIRHHHQSNRMFSNHPNCTNVLQQQEHRQQHQRHQQCSHLQKHKAKQFIQLLTCLVTVIRVISLPEFSAAQPQQQQQQHEHQQQQQQQQHSRQLVSMNPETTPFLSNNITNFLATTTKTATRRTITIPFNANATAIATTNQVTTFFSNSTTTTTTITTTSTTTKHNRNNSTSRHNINSYTYVDDERNTNDDNDKTKLAQVLSTTKTTTTAATSATATATSSSLSSTLVENSSPSSIVKSSDFVMSNETFDFTPSPIRYQADGKSFLRVPRSLVSGKSSAATGGIDDTGLKMFGISGSSSITNMFNSQTATGFNANIIIECPSFDENSACPCYKFEDGLFLECPGTTAISLRSTLERISSPIHSLSIYDFDRSVTSLSQDVFQPGVNIRHLQFSHSHLETLKDNSLKNVRASLESLSIVNGKLTQLPSRALNSMQKLNALDFDYNEISLIEDYSFYGLRLSKLNMKGNRLQGIPEYGFAGLEESMQEIDLSENSLRTFPLLSLRKLDYLRILRLSNNKISTFYGDITLATNNATAVAALRLPSLTFLDLSSNQFTEIIDDCFRAFPQLKTLSFYANQIEIVQAEAFKSLRELMSLDMSHNRIITLDAKIFEKNKRLQTVDLSHNHIHLIGGVFANLPHLREIFLSENNILELPADAFTNSSNVEVIYLESNAIAHIDPNVFTTLGNLDHLYLRANFIPLLPVTLLDKCQKLSSLSLDNNEIQDLEIGMFRKLEFLREVRLHNNRIRRIRKGVFEPLPALQELHVQKNNIEDIEPGAFETLINLQHINLQDNQLTVLEDIFPNDSKNSSLLTIQLETNYLNKVHTKTFQNQNKIQIMWLSDNQLMRIEKSMFEDQNDLGRLYLNKNLIRDIDRETFGSLKNLKYLDLSYNRLKQLRRDFFSSLENLEELILKRNFIEAIEGFAFSKLKNLKVLDLSDNPIHHITNDAFLQELSLIQLNLRNTSLKRIEVDAFKSLPNLNELDLSWNFLNPGDIQKLDVASLRILYLSNNNFSGIITPNMFHKLRSLQQLSLANCCLATLPEELFSKNTNLVKLDLCDNLLSLMNRNLFHGLNVFKELRVCRNNLMEFPHIALYNLSTLEILDLSRNQFTTVDFYKLSGTLNLRQLNLKDNKINSLSGFNAVNLTQLDNVDISGNMLLSLPANFLRHSINLQKVDLSSNRFLQIPSSALSDVSIPRLSWLNLTGNPINKIYTVKEERYPYLKELYICQTNLSILTSKDFEAFQALQHLHLVNNRITRISPGAFKSLINLLTLDMSVNELEILPKERLQGLKLLRLLNISHNTLKDLEEFSSDLSQLQICDLSFNQLDRISRKTFRNLHGLVELYLMGNRMTVLSTDAFRYLRKLHMLDLRKNYFELIPIDALQPLETNMKTLRLEENPLHCSCDAQKLWEWLRDHRKWSSSLTLGLTSTAMSTTMSSMSSSSSSALITTANDNINYLRCEHPAELRGKIFAKMEPQQFCDAPLIPKIAIQDIQPYSVIVSWQSREHLGLNGYEIIYHAIGDNVATGAAIAVGGGIGGSVSNSAGVIGPGGGTGTGTGISIVNNGGPSGDMDEIRGKRLNGSANSAKLTKLSPNTRYHICVIGTGNWLSEPVANALQRIHFNDSFLSMGHDDITSQAIVLPSSANYQTIYGRQAASYQSPYSRMTNAYGSGDVSFSEHTLLAQPQQQQALIENTIDTDNALQEVLKNSRFSTCTDVQTLDSTPSLITDENGLASNGFIHSILTRRLGLIVGCCLGIIVFIVMISVLSYVKLKKQRIENAKRQATMPPDYMSYRHFSIPNEELLRSGTVMSSVPSGISAHISGTSLSTSGTTTATATTPLGILKVTESMGGVGVTTTGGSSSTAMMAVVVLGG
uniref:Fibronectin type-III domain-containing protein n=1 Tax=Glossina brevipalpis TaxID=37001 RepID=A0A1A9WPL0_9MUSC